MRKRMVGLAAGLALAASGAVSLAGFITPDGYGWSRGDARSAYFGWDVFVGTTGGNEPDTGQFPDPLPSGWAEPDVVETTGDAFITASGNIYSPFGPINVEVSVPNYGLGAGQTTLLLQVKTVGNELDYAGVTLDGGVLPTEIVELDRQAGDMGYEVDTLFVFEVDGNAGLYVLDIPTADAHCGVDQIAVDTFADAGDCVADFNGDGTADTRDVIGFLNAWAAGEGSADINGDGAVDTRDVIGFLNLWVAGC